MRSVFISLAACLLGSALAASPDAQVAFRPEGAASEEASGSHSSGRSKPRPLTGRFLHITDLHPDPFYKVDASTDGDDVCHRGNGTSGYYGAESASCDSPLALVNATFTWIAEHLKDEIDFIIWTGDSARHDNDEHIPRDRDQVVGLNKYAVTKFREVFGRGGDDGDDDDDDEDNLLDDMTVPIVPTYGNNDILPHNVFFQGPNPWTRMYLSIWRSFIPEAQRHSFATGGWFFREVIPNQLAVFSLNSIYFFDHNSAVDGCANRHEPGYRQFEWLRIQLQFLRRRGMKAIITGHVPPARTDSKELWDETCWQKYTLWMQQYRDVVVGSVWGHMNLDHFMLHDTADLDIALLDGTRVAPYRQPLPPDGRMSVQSKEDYLDDLRVQWQDLPDHPKDADAGWDAVHRTKKHEEDLAQYYTRIGGAFAERYSLSLVSPSVVPDYFPTLRIVSYNVSGLEHIDRRPNDDTDRPASVGSVDDVYDREQFLFKKKKKHSFKTPKGPSKSAPPGPAYSPQPFTWAGYRQLFANLTTLNAAASAAKHNKHKGPPPFAFELEYDTHHDPVYDLPDLTVRSYLRLAQRAGQYEPPEEDEEERHGGKEKEGKKKEKRNRPWLTFVTRAFVGAKEVDEGRFGRGAQAGGVPASPGAAQEEL